MIGAPRVGGHGSWADSSGMLPIRSRADDGVVSHRVAIAALGLAVSRARVTPAGPAASAVIGRQAVRVTDAPKSPSRRRSRGRSSLRAQPGGAGSVVPLAELVARRTARGHRSEG